MKRKEIIWLRSPFVTCHYPEGFRWLTSHPKPRVGKLAAKQNASHCSPGSKSIKNRYRVCTIWLVGLEEEIIDKDFRQSYWLALQFWVQTNRIFTVAVPQASHGKTPLENISITLLKIWLKSHEHRGCYCWKKLPWTILENSYRWREILLNVK